MSIRSGKVFLQTQIIEGTKKMAKMPNLSAMSFEELKTLAKDVEKAIAKAEREQMKKAKAAAEEAAKKFGFTLDTIVGGQKSAGKPAKSSAAPKYKNPDDSSQTWTGRGRQPAWFKAAIEAGKKPEDMEI